MEGLIIRLYYLLVLVNCWFFFVGILMLFLMSLIVLVFLGEILSLSWFVIKEINDSLLLWYKILGYLEFMLCSS